MNVPKPALRVDSRSTERAEFIALSGVPLVKTGDNLTSVINDALRVSHEALRDGDVIVIAQKIVSKAQGRRVVLDSVAPSSEARALARVVNKDERLVELILRESTEVVRQAPGVLIVAHKLGMVIANAGIDQSNVESGDAAALLLPENPDETCAVLRAKLLELTGADVAVMINDSHGRAFRNGTVGVAIGASGLPALMDRRGESDLFGRKLRNTEVALADEIASAASLLMGQADEARPIVIARGVPKRRQEGSAAELIRPKGLDLFRSESAEMLLLGRRSIRRYGSEPIPEGLLEKILRTAIFAPSAHNRQPWRFAIIGDLGSKARLANAMGERLRADRLGDGDPADAVEEDVAKSFARITAAPATVLVCLTMEDMDHYPDTRRVNAERTMAVQGTAMAVHNLLLAAHAAGLGASVMCAPLFCPEAVGTVLNLPAQWEPQALVTLGYPANSGKPPVRKPLESFLQIVRARP